MLRTDIVITCHQYIWQIYSKFTKQIEFRLRNIDDQLDTVRRDHDISVGSNVKSCYDAVQYYMMLLEYNY